MVLRDSFIFWLDSDKVCIIDIVWCSNDVVQTTEVKGSCSTARCQVIAPETIMTQESDNLNFKCTIFLITPEGQKIELATDTVQEKEEWLAAYKKSCDYIRGCFEDDGMIEHGPYKSKINLSEKIDGWMKVNDKRVFCCVREGMLMWFNEEPSPVPTCTPL